MAQIGLQVELSRRHDQEPVSVTAPHQGECCFCRAQQGHGLIRRCRASQGPRKSFRKDLVRS